MIGGAAYPNPSTIASNVGVNPPVLSIPVMEHINLPAKAIAPYIPEFQTYTSRMSGNHEKKYIFYHYFVQKTMHTRKYRKGSKKEQSKSNIDDSCKTTTELQNQNRVQFGYPV